MADWYFADERNHWGPVSERELSNMLQTGYLPADTLVWTEGLPSWTSAQFIPQLLSGPPPLPGSSMPFPNCEEHGGLTTPPALPRADAAMTAPDSAQMNSMTPASDSLMRLRTKDTPAGYAGFWKRVAAMLIDNILLSVIISIIAIGIIVFGSLIGIDDEQIADYITLQIVLISVGVSWLYSAGFESSVWQATPGKRVLGIVVVNLYWNRITFLHATGRHLASYISVFVLFAGFLIAAFTPRKQALHDLIAECLVVNKP